MCEKQWPSSSSAAAAAAGGEKRREEYSTEPDAGLSSEKLDLSLCYTRLLVSCTRVFATSLPT